MTDHDSDQRLREAFQGDEHPPSAPLPDQLQEQIWRAVSGDLDPDQRRDLVDRTATDPAAAEAWRVAHALWEARQSGRQHAPVSLSRSRRRPWTSPWLAAAATVMLVSAIVTVQYWRSSGDEFRVVPNTSVESLIPNNALLPRDAVLLRWTPGAENARYRVRVTTEDLSVITSTGELTETEYLVEPAALADVPEGATLLWQVEMSLPTGQTVSSATFSVRVT